MSVIVIRDLVRLKMLHSSSLCSGLYFDIKDSIFRENEMKFLLLCWFYLDTFLLTKREMTSRASEEIGFVHIFQT